MHIRFKAWDKERKVMLKHFEVLPILKDIYSGKLKQYNLLLYTGKRYTDNYGFIPQNKLVGIEICNHDILKHKNKLYVVNYYDDKCKFILCELNSFKEYVKDHMYYMEYNDCYSSYMEWCYDVNEDKSSILQFDEYDGYYYVGNVYENKELMHDSTGDNNE